MWSIFGRYSGVFFGGRYSIKPQWPACNTEVCNVFHYCLQCFTWASASHFEQELVLWPLLGCCLPPTTTFAASLFHSCFNSWWLHLDGQHNHLRLYNSCQRLPSGTAFKKNTPAFLFPHLPLIRCCCLVRHLARWARTTFSATHQGWTWQFSLRTSAQNIS